LNYFVSLAEFNLLDRVKGIQNHTLNVATLINDISKFVSTTNTNEADRIRILSNFDNNTTDKAYKSYKDFAKYYRKYNQINRIVNQFVN